MRKTIKILGVTWKIKFFPDDGKHNGYVVYDDKTIFLNSSLSKENLKRTFYHEVSHAYQYECGLYDFIDKGCQEMIAQTMSALLCELRL